MAVNTTSLPLISGYSQLQTPNIPGTKQVLEPGSSDKFSLEKAYQPNSRPIEAKDGSVEETKPSVNSDSIGVDKNVDYLLENLNKALENLQNYLAFERDESSERMVVFIRDTQTNETIRQIPAEELLVISNNIQSYLEQVNQLPGSQSMPPTGMITDEVV